MLTGILLPCIVNTIKSLKDGSISICVETQELTPSKAGEIFGLRNKVVLAYMSVKETISQKEIDNVDKLDADMPGKTQSQRLRGVLFRLWEQENEGYKTFDQYYKYKTDKIIDHYKSELNP